MPPDIPIHRRQSDQLIEMLVNQAREDREEAREWRVQAMIKLESIPVVVITQASHGLRLDKVEPKVQALEDLMQREVLPALKRGATDTTSDSGSALVVNARFKNWRWPLAVLGTGGAGLGLGAWVKGMLAAISQAVPH